jgi:hypothetical protein
MTFKKGDRVKHPAMESWGLGLVLNDSDANKVRVFFVEGGEKTMLLSRVQLRKVSGEEAKSDELDNLKISNGAISIRYKSLNASMEYFLSAFPGGFRGERFRAERDDKVEISRLAADQLGKDVLHAMLAKGDYEGICTRALKLTGAMKNAMIFKNEKMALRDGLESSQAKQRFAEALYQLLHGEEDFGGRFTSFSNCLQEMHADKWTIATYFLFFMHPDRFMFVKPTITQHAAEVCAYEINYRSELNQRTYQSILEFSAYLKEKIRILEPRDMIDVQSFMWCIAPGTYD